MWRFNDICLQLHTTKSNIRTNFPHGKYMYTAIPVYSRRYMADILQILRKTLSNQSINQSINQHSRSIVSQGTSGSFHKNFYEQFWSFKRKHTIHLLFTKNLTRILVCKSVVKFVRSLFKLDVSTYNKNDKSQTNK